MKMEFNNKNNINIILENIKNSKYKTNFSYFIYKFEKINEINFNKIFENKYHFSMTVSNTTKNKKSHELYKYCKNNIIVSEDIIKQIKKDFYYLPHFYNKSELYLNNKYNSNVSLID